MGWAAAGNLIVAPKYSHYFSPVLTLFHSDQITHCPLHVTLYPLFVMSPAFLSGLCPSHPVKATRGCPNLHTPYLPPQGDFFLSPYSFIHPPPIFVLSQGWIRRSTVGTTLFYISLHLLNFASPQFFANLCLDDLLVGIVNRLLDFHPLVLEIMFNIYLVGLISQVI